MRLPIMVATVTLILFLTSGSAGYFFERALAQTDTDTLYTPFDKVTVRIFSPDSNQHRNEVETIKVLVSSSFTQKQFSFAETGLNTGVFEKEIRLSPDLSRFPGDLETRRDDGVSVSFRIDSDTVITQSIHVNYRVGDAFFDKSSYELSDRVKITVEDRDMNRHPDTVDTLSGRLWSTTDRGGLFVTLLETGASTGVFEEFITFTIDDASSGTRLKVQDGDTITFKYTDSTLPPPVALSSDGVQTVEVREIFTESIFGQVLPSTDRVNINELSLVDYTGRDISEVNVGQQILVQTELNNNQNRKQPFVYILQVKNSDGITVALSWISSELLPEATLKVAQSWIPSSAGTYEIEVFAWQSLTNPSALSIQEGITVDVAG